MTAAPRNANCPLWVRARLKGVPSRCYGMYNVNLSSIGQIIPSQWGFSLCVSSLLDAGHIMGAWELCLKTFLPRGWRPFLQCIVAEAPSGASLPLS